MYVLVVVLRLILVRMCRSADRHMHSHAVRHKTMHRTWTQVSLFLSYAFCYFVFGGQVWNTGGAIFSTGEAHALPVKQSDIDGPRE